MNHKEGLYFEPFKRNNFKGIFKIDNGTLRKSWLKAARTFEDVYKTYFRSKKYYIVDNKINSIESKCPFASLFKK